MGSVALAQGTSVLFGTIIDASTKQPIPDVVVTARAPSLQGEQSVVTDSSGEYRIPQLPSGVYTLRFDKEAYRLLSRDGITLRLGYSVRVNVELLPAPGAAADTYGVSLSGATSPENQYFIDGLSVECSQHRGQWHTAERRVHPGGERPHRRLPARVRPLHGRSG
ncbi:TonB-dependent receptor [Cystobacter fuscus DSM 2262]|uniref:TonB-dependent receptor n=1 Tax=Cystobacter fuscus (strain ATCC 25194 / DSM 2262 / NBRC 100088 / M29) TaxID=1242864 RepID=S9PI24_CYSF2|nr:carboxypeptidase-like regulatory domain-containing protein [Cystobacter fuscus]EPX62042.1 TonB-dependent receptor [Cystobacter fuscus DSM 2262]